VARQFNKQGMRGAAGAMPGPATGTRHAKHARQGQDRSTQGTRGKGEERKGVARERSLAATQRQRTLWILRVFAGTFWVFRVHIPRAHALFKCALLWCCSKGVGYMGQYRLSLRRG